MAKKKIKFLCARKSGSKILYYWIPSAALAGRQSIPLGSDLSTAEDKARQINAALNEPSAAVEPAKYRIPRSLADAIAAYRASTFFTDDIELSTRNFYRWHFATLEEWAGDEPVTSITPVTVHEFFVLIRDGKPVEQILVERKLADTTKNRRWAETQRGGHKTKAVNTIKTLRRVLEHARFLGWIATNPAVRQGCRTPDRENEIVLWTDEMVEAFIVAADSMGRHSVGTAVLINYWMGQREGDILRLPLAMVTARAADIRQKKNGAKVRLRIRKVPHVRQRIDEELARRSAGIASTAFIISEQTKRPYTARNFSTWVRKITDRVAAEAERQGNDDLASAVIGVEFCWLRHTAVTTLARSGSTIPEIAEVTGHSLKSVYDILKHYVVNTGDLADNAFSRRMAAEGIVEIDEANVS